MTRTSRLIRRAHAALKAGEKLLRGNAKFNRSVDRMLGAARVR